MFSHIVCLLTCQLLLLKELALTFLRSQISMDLTLDFWITNKLTVSFSPLFVISSFFPFPFFLSRDGNCRNDETFIIHTV
ncbi:hypothetical protein P167DRAFT_29966 [Morchella conica CCBAS932]|uniref:Uncharacterized protein n=1 Tax=Morchella conica CCBAS932 TaxID=1392247 RepID=A0A3N4KWS6_9PEZI|nr:hypothetical protein P167DRAFT_29966 [Morchella conica CCBAS932]